MNRFKRVRYILNQILKKIKEASPLGFFIGGLFLALVISILINQKTPLSNFSSILEVFALFVFINGLNKIQKHFTGQGFLDSVFDWLKNLKDVFKKPNSVVIPLSAGTYTISGGSANARKRYNLENPEFSLDERVEKLILNFKEMDSDLTEMRSLVGKNKKELKERITKVEERFNAKSNAIRKLISDLDEQFEDVQLSSVYYELVGIFWLIIAVLLEMPFINRFLNSLL